MIRLNSKTSTAVVDCSFCCYEVECKVRRYGAPYGLGYPHSRDVHLIESPERYVAGATREDLYQVKCVVCGRKKTVSSPEQAICLYKQITEGWYSSR